MPFYSVQSFDSTIFFKIVFYQNTKIWNLGLLVLVFLLVAFQKENGGQLFRRYIFIQHHSSLNYCFIKNPISLHKRAVILSAKQLKVKQQHVNALFLVPMESVCSHHEAALPPHSVCTQALLLLLWYNLHDLNGWRKPAALLQHLQLCWVEYLGLYSWQLLFVIAPLTQDKRKKKLGTKF